MKKTLMILLGLGAFLPAATAQSGPPAAAAAAFRLEAEQALHGPDTLEIRI
jgi:hypothetical protein